MFVDPTPQSSTRGLELHSHRSTHRSFTMEDHGKDPSHAIIVRTDLGIVYDDDLCRPSLSRHCVNRSFTPLAAPSDQPFALQSAWPTDELIIANPMRTLRLTLINSRSFAPIILQS